VSVITKNAVTGFAGASLVSVLALSSGVALATMTLASTEAKAQGFFSFWDAPPRPRKVKRPRPVTMPDDDEIASTEPAKPTTGPLIINVSIRKQRLGVYDANGLVAEAPVSSGRVGYATPTGVFTLLEKNRVHFSNLYDSAPMPNMQRLTWSGVALHAGQLPGYPASHGCIRLPHGFSKKLFGMTKLGTRVIVSRDPAPPIAIEHDRLFKTYPGESALSTASIGTGPEATKVVDASNQMVGPAPANGTNVAEAGESTPVSPSEARILAYRERRMAELGELSGAVREAGYKKMELSTHIAQASKDAADARAVLSKAKAEAEKVGRIARKAAAAKEAADKEFSKFAKKLTASQKMTDEQVHKAPQKWDELEAKAKKLSEAAEVAGRAAAQADEAVKAVEPVAIEAEMHRRTIVNEFTKASAALAAAVAAEEAAKRREAKRALPVSVFISRATQRLYVRQGYEPILDVPVTFDQADQPVGTHVFTALDYKPNKTEMAWSVSSTGYTAPAQNVAKKKRRDEAAMTPTSSVVDSSLQTASAALDRITIPDDVRDAIVDVMKPGSSLVISDHGISNETGKFTDFIVLTR
jgi:lipoprotein-anchoring transpeptidase ErfK/SrfK